MPLASVWLIRLALLHFVSAAVIGSLYLAFKGAGWFPFVALWRMTHVEQMLVGWMVQLVMGVAWWILPRTGDIARGGAARSAEFIWLVLVLVNAGVLLAALGTIAGFPTGLTTAGRVLEAMAALLFASLAWNRQRPYRVATRKTLV